MEVTHSLAQKQLRREPSIERYWEEFDYLVDYAKSDWLNFCPVEGTARVLVGADASVECHREMVLHLVAGLFDAGVRPIDLTSHPGPSFILWATDREQILGRVDREMAAREDSVDFIDICWFTAV